ncbi:hypothetical protein M9434_005831 [Picochlorum sp. BPE23]|nr:hypothetical protein M9434_005831 [Picochlorum sp. BPE23]
MNRVAIALGSNLGDRTKNLATALKRLQAEYREQITVEKVSRLYESAPQYVTDQPAFLNAAAEVKTTLSPLSLLSALKTIEKDLGRSFGADQIRWGPRPIDLDIIFYEEEQVLEGDGQLIVPHPRWQERDFVKAPLADLTPSVGDAVPRGLDKALVAAKNLWNDQGGEKALKKYSKDAQLSCVLPLGPMDTWSWSHQTSVMGILNVTPDSFSDGGQHVNVDHAITAAFDMVSDGADIIDIGGQSTRPGATQIDPDEEWKRVEPVIKAIRSEPSLLSVPISIDTFYSDVAEKAVAAGANIVNDVSGGTADPRMFRAVADMDVTYILMHMRGTPKTMQNSENVQYNNVCEDVAAALEASCRAAVEEGIESWRIVLDPGIGFAKNHKGNVDLVAHLPRLRSCIAEPYKNLPILLGPSRKKFLGTLIERESGPPMERDWATCAISAISAMRGANIIRAHNVRAAKDATMVSDGIMQHL